MNTEMKPVLIQVGSFLSLECPGRLCPMQTYMRQFLCCVACTLLIDPRYVERFSRYQCVVRLISVNRNSSVDTGTELAAVRFFFSSPKHRKQALGTIQPTITTAPGVKRPGREADHSPPFNAYVRNVWRYTAIPLH
jgi:hypothetical protein